MENDRSKKILQSIEARELQKFFNNTKSVLLIPKGNDGKLATSSLALLFDKDTYKDFEKYELKNNLQELFKNKYPILVITIRDGKAFVGLAVRDMSSPLKFTFPDQPVGVTLSHFIETTPEGAEILMNIGYTENGTIFIDAEKDVYHLLTIKGYYFDNIMWGLTDSKAFGVDSNQTVVEKIPIVVTPVTNVHLKRAFYKLESETLSIRKV